MSDEKKDEPDKGEGGVYRVETVPPPAGEDDAYSAPTKVGPVGDAFVQSLMKDAEHRNAELARKDGQNRKDQAKKQPQESAPTSKRAGAEESPPSSKVPVSAGGTPLPRIYDEADDGDGDGDAATKLSPMAKPPEMPHRPMGLQVPSDTSKGPAPSQVPVPPPPGDLLRQYAPELAPPSSSAPLPRSAPPADSPLPPLTPPTPASREPIPFDPLRQESLPSRTNPRTIALFALLVILAMIAVLLFTRR